MHSTISKTYKPDYLNPRDVIVNDQLVRKTTVNASDLVYPARHHANVLDARTTNILTTS